MLEITLCMFILFFIMMTFIYKKLSIGWTFQLLLKDFNRKMWMTLGLGISFFGFYIFLVPLIQWLFKGNEHEIFFLVYQNPVPFIYGGLGFFAFLSLMIYVLRMIIKSIYFKVGKDS